MKTCTTCHIEKSLEEFTRCTAIKSGRTSKCKSCINSYRKDRIEKGLSSKTDYFKKAIYMKRCKCKREGITFNLTANYLLKLWTEVCPALGLILTTGDISLDGNAHLDRKDPTLGYVMGNVVFMSSLANRIKTNVTDPNMLRKVATFMEK